MECRECEFSLDTAKMIKFMRAGFVPFAGVACLHAHFQLVIVIHEQNFQEPWTYIQGRIPGSTDKLIYEHKESRELYQKILWN